MKLTRGAMRVLAVTAAMAAGLGVMSPAQASTTRDGCTVDPHTPYHNGTFTLSGDKWINYDVEITCSAGRTIEVDMERWEADNGLNGVDDFIGASTKVRVFNTSSTYLWTVTGVLPDNDGGLDQYSEMYQRVRFQVTSNGVVGSWTVWDDSATRSIHV